MSDMTKVLDRAEALRLSSERVARIAALREAFEIAEEAHKRAAPGEPSAVAFEIATAIHRKVMDT